MNWELLISITMLLITIATLVLNLIVRRIDEKTNNLMVLQELLHEMIKTQHKMIDEIVEKKQKKETRTK